MVVFFWNFVPSTLSPTTHHWDLGHSHEGSVPQFHWSTLGRILILPIIKATVALELSVQQNSLFFFVEPSPDLDLATILSLSSTGSFFDLFSFLLNTSERVDEPGSHNKHFLFLLTLVSGPNTHCCGTASSSICCESVGCVGTKS